MTPTPSNNFLIGESRWARVIELIDQNMTPVEIAKRMEIDLATVKAIGADYAGVAG